MANAEHHFHSFHHSSLSLFVTHSLENPQCSHAHAPSSPPPLLSLISGTSTPSFATNQTHCANLTVFHKGKNDHKDKQNNEQRKNKWIMKPMRLYQKTNDNLTVPLGLFCSGWEVFGPVPCLSWLMHQAPSVEHMVGLAQ